MIRAAFAVGIVLFFAYLFLKTCGTDLREQIASLNGILDAASKELRFRGGRAAKANITLSILAALLLGLITLHGVLDEVIEFIGGHQGQGSGNNLALLFGCLLFFFFLSLCFVSANERYSDKMRK